jgi:hypothetical protein
VHIGPLICLIGITLVIFMRIHGFEVGDSCKLVLVLPSTPLFDDFWKETDEKPREFDMLAQMGKKIGCNLIFRVKNLGKNWTVRFIGELVKWEEGNDDLHVTYTTVNAVSLWWIEITDMVPIKQIRGPICTFFK